MNQTACATPNMLPLPDGVAADTGDERFPWDALVARVLKPVKVEIIEAMRWIGLPLAASDLVLVFDKAYSLSLLDYHVKELARIGAIRLVRTEPVRGTLKHSYLTVGASGL
jgi:hypothetical protein